MAFVLGQMDRLMEHQFQVSSSFDIFIHICFFGSRHQQGPISIQDVQWDR
jgi:hypothetical protein